MKHTRHTALLLFLCLLCAASIFAQNPKREFRATWLTTHYSIDWPKTKATSYATITQQQNELLAILDKLVAANMNAFTFQIRPSADAFYKSSYEPWSDQLTGKRGQYPGYDPLAFAVEEAHRRGLEIHVWLNPYRYEVNAGSWGDDDPLRRDHSDWLLTFKNGTFNGTILDPGLPEARAYTVKVIQEVVENYDIDGIIFDDYFYPYGGTTTEDAASMALYKPVYQTKADWRRENVDKLIKDVYDMLQATKPWVRFGMAPSGIWTMDTSAAKRYGISLPAGIWGMDAYTTLYCNTLEWLNQGTVDYIAPQIYWSTTASGHDYDVLSQWWSDMVKHFSELLPDNQKIHFFSSNNDYSDWVTPLEMGLEVEANRRADQMGGTGAIFYNTSAFFSNKLHDYFPSAQFSTRALPPAMDWKETEVLETPENIAIQYGSLTWYQSDAPRFTVYAFPKGTELDVALSDPANLLGVTWEDSYDIMDIEHPERLTFAVCSYDNYGNEYEAAIYNVPTDVENVDESLLRIKSSENGVLVQFVGTHRVEIYSANGVCITSVVATDDYSYTLPRGVYIIRVGNAVRKFVK